jgi:hypothetical protein
LNVQDLDHLLASSLHNRQPHTGLKAMATHATPRYVVWWGCLCGWTVWRPAPPPAEDEWLGIASRWVATGDDELRRLADRHASTEQVGICNWLLRGVVNSGGTLTSSDKAAEMPTPDYAGRYAFGFVQHLLALQSPVERAPLSETFVHLARQTIACPLPQQAA